MQVRLSVPCLSESTWVWTPRTCVKLGGSSMSLESQCLHRQGEVCIWVWACIYRVSTWRSEDILTVTLLLPMWLLGWVFRLVNSVFDAEPPYLHNNTFLCAHILPLSFLDSWFSSNSVHYLFCWHNKKATRRQMRGQLPFLFYFCATLC